MYLETCRLASLHWADQYGICKTISVLITKLSLLKFVHIVKNGDTERGGLWGFMPSKLIIFLDMALNIEGWIYHKPQPIPFAVIILPD